MPTAPTLTCHASYRNRYTASHMLRASWPRSVRAPTRPSACAPPTPRKRMFPATHAESLLSRGGLKAVVHGQLPPATPSNRLLGNSRQPIARQPVAACEQLLATPMELLSSCWRHNYVTPRSWATLGNRQSQPTGNRTLMWLEVGLWHWI